MTDFENKQKSIDSVIAYFNSIEKTLDKSRKLSSLVIIAAACIICAALIGALYLVNQSSRRIYAFDTNNNIISAGLLTEDVTQRECQAFLEYIHELMFTNVPNKQAIQERWTRAGELGDKSIYDTYQRFNEQNYFARMIQNSMNTYYKIDNMEIDCSKHPYSATITGTQLTVRATSMEEYTWITTCKIKKENRTFANPFGLSAEHFAIVSQQKRETKSRN